MDVQGSAKYPGTRRPFNSYNALRNGTPMKHLLFAILRVRQSISDGRAVMQEATGKVYTVALALF